MTDAPPPPSGEPLKPIVLPADSTAGPSTAGASTSGPAYGEPLTPTVLPSGSPTRSSVLLFAVAGAAFVLLVANSVGLAGFPSNAPVEMLYALGVNLDLVAIIATGVIGGILSRRGYPLRGSTPISIVALAFAAGAFVAWIVFGGIGSIVELIPPDRGRYMYASGGLFYGGALWTLAAIFGAHAYRRGGQARSNAFALAALGTVAVLAAYAVVSSVIYGAGLTD